MEGRGLHTGRKVHLRILPSHGGEESRGIVFRRVRGHECLSEAHTRYSLWRKQPLCSTLQGSNGMLFRTVEHILAALLMREIDHAVVEMDAEEVPILDGGAAEWIQAIDACGREDLTVPKRFIRITKPFEYTFGEISVYRIEPARSYEADVTGLERGFTPMRWAGTLTPDSFVAEIAPARSHGHLLAAVPAILGGYLWGKPILRGARISSVAAIFNKRVIGGMTVPDEFVRHRVLDMVGDFAIAGAPLLGKVTVRRPSHRRNQKFMRTLLNDKGCWEWASFDDKK